MIILGKHNGIAVIRPYRRIRFWQGEHWMNTISISGIMGTVTDVKFTVYKMVYHLRECETSK